MAVKTKVVNRIYAAKKAIPSTKFYPRTSCTETPVPSDSSNKPMFKDASSATVTAMPGYSESSLPWEGFVEPPPMNKNSRSDRNHPFYNRGLQCRRG